jgi:hypothetical protein
LSDSVSGKLNFGFATPNRTFLGCEINGVKPLFDAKNHFIAKHVALIDLNSYISVDKKQVVILLAW